MSTRLHYIEHDVSVVLTSLVDHVGQIQLRRARSQKTATSHQETVLVLLNRSRLHIGQSE